MRTKSAFALTLSLGMAAPALAATPPPAAPPDMVVYGLTIALGLIGIAALISINIVLFRTKWSLAEALSEEVNLPLYLNGQVLMANGQPILAPKLTASTSRLIALFGLFGILLLYVGFGTIILYSFAMGRGAPAGTDQVTSFLLTGLTLFAPYAVNKAASVFTNSAPKKPT